jgi:hypothetical protein
MAYPTLTQAPVPLSHHSITPSLQFGFGNANRTSEPGLGANECVLSGKWRKSTAFRQPSPATTSRAKAAASLHELRRLAPTL